ncbi:MAG: hypothetical protein ACRDPC_23605, partial [Solirubrobacteraceae bacterium]
MSLTNTNREARRTQRPVAMRDLRFAGTVAAGLVAGVLGIGALSAPILGWSTWPDELRPGRDQVVRLQAPGERQPVADRDSDRSGGRTGAGPAPVALAVDSDGATTLVAATGTTPAAPASPGESGREAVRVGSGVQRDRSGTGFGGGGFDPADVSDTDGDGMPDVWERRYGLNPLRAGDASGDDDGDGIPNSAEFHTRSLPTSGDSNGDGIPDGEDDFDGDGLRNSVEVRTGSHAWERDSNGDGVDDGHDDHDGDDVPSGDEENAGTDPTIVDPAPVPPPSEPAPGDTPPEPAPPGEPPVATEPDPVDVEEPAEDDEGSEPEAPEEEAPVEEPAPPAEPDPQPEPEA